MFKEETVKECLMRKFEICDNDEMDWYIRNVVDSLKSFVKDDYLAKLLISDFYLLFMKIELEKAEKAEIEKAEKAEIEKASNDEIDNLLNSITEDLNSIIATLE